MDLKWKQIALNHRHRWTLLHQRLWYGFLCSNINSNWLHSQKQKKQISKVICILKKYEHLFSFSIVKKWKVLFKRMISKSIYTVNEKTGLEPQVTYLERSLRGESILFIIFLLSTSWCLTFDKYAKKWLLNEIA